MARMKFLPKTIFSKTKICRRQKNPKMELLLKTKKRLTADFYLGSTGGWGGEGISKTMLMIGNLIVIKGLT